ncbi:MAG TPA: DUF1295 domain-containing protein [Bacteroides sp.]|nr:DUF1295 domain-containing protein [Bacteroides sp.]
MKNRLLNRAGLLSLAVIFSVALMFTFTELPAFIDQLLQNRIGFPQFDQGAGEVNRLKTELFISGLHLRWIGYGALLLILALIITGYATKRTGWAMAGAVGLFIPVFGQFALSMFFLAGLGLLRVGWLPFLEITSFDVLDLGKVIYVPYWIFMWFFGLFGWKAHAVLSYFFMGTGAFLFAWGVLVWIRTRTEGSKIASDRIYRISRHPQYLGWILWSYGFILFTPFINQMRKSWSVPSSMPWLVMTMVIIGICLLEELRMMEITGGEYNKYRSSSPFLIPLPGWLNRIITWPARLVTRGGYPTRRIQVLWIVLIYTGICISLSLLWVDFKRDRPEKIAGTKTREALNEIVAELDNAGDNRKKIFSLMEPIPGFGPGGMEALSLLTGHENPIIREFSIQMLGRQKITAAEDLFIHAMHDSVWRVRNSGIIAAGEIRSEKATEHLIPMLDEPGMDRSLVLIYSALGSIGTHAAIPYLVAGLDGGEHYFQQSALEALMVIDPSAGIDHAIGELKDEDVQVRRNAVLACIRSGDPRVIEPLRFLYSDEDFEVRLYARQGIKRMQKDTLKRQRTTGNSVIRRVVQP